MYEYACVCVCWGGGGLRIVGDSRSCAHVVLLLPLLGAATGPQLHVLGVVLRRHEAEQGLAAGTLEGRVSAACRGWEI